MKADGRRRFVPEVVQTSAMDCGPAVLTSVLEGFGIPACYGRVREACQTDVDGTSIDSLEELLVELGFDAEQVMLPLDMLLERETDALPAIVVARQANGLTHFVVAWQRHGPWVQVMDPATGRRWPTVARFLEEMYVHTHEVPVEEWRAWASTRSFLEPLGARLARVGADGSALVASALTDESWRSIAALDGVARMVDRLIRAGGLDRGPEAARVLGTLFDRTRAEGDTEAVPASFWSVRPSTGGAGQLQLRGAVLVKVRGRREASSGVAPSSLPLEIAAALAEPSPRPGRELLRMLRTDGLLAPAFLVAALAVAATGVLLEALLFRGLLDVARVFGPGRHRLLAVGATVALVAALLLIELPIASGLIAIGRRLETRLRIAFLEKLPRLAYRYFRSRPSSDMAERSQTTHQIRTLPRLGADLIRSAMSLVVTTIGIAWLDPPSAPLAVVAASVCLVLPLAAQPILRERDLRARTHVGALGRFYLDAFLGLVALRAHGGQRALRREHESLLVEWTRAARTLARTVVGFEATHTLLGFALVAWLIVAYLRGGGGGGAVLLLTYWALQLPVLGGAFAQAAWQYPAHRNRTLRLLEPLGAIDAEAREPEATQPELPLAARAGVGIELEGVSIAAGGHTILEQLELSIRPGSHVAIVGPSGAGKSSLVGLLLGWHQASAGRVLIDGAPLDRVGLARLRRETAWVDPEVQIWNRSLLDNLSFGGPRDSPRPFVELVDASELRRVLEMLPDGMQTVLGESGALVSGGEGQRVRLARALGRAEARLVILDEPFRGLDRDQRRALLDRARAWWRDATLLCITHDVEHTRGFPRVLVVDGGRVVEDGAPEQLAREGARYRALLQAEESVRVGLWARGWRRLHLENGRLDRDEPA